MGHNIFGDEVDDEASAGLLQMALMANARAKTKTKIFGFVSLIAVISTIVGVVALFLNNYEIFNYSILISYSLQGVRILFNELFWKKRLLGIIFKLIILIILFFVGYYLIGLTWWNFSNQLSFATGLVVANVACLFL